MIYVYNKHIDDFSWSKNNYEIGRPYVLQNPYTHLELEKTKARYKVKTREEAIEKYSHYFDIMYGSNKEFTNVIDEIYEKYKRGENVYLACWCKKYSVFDPKYKESTELICHGDIIVNKLRKKLVKEKLKNLPECKCPKRTKTRENE